MSATKSNPNKRRLHDIDDTIESLTHSINNLTDFVTKTELESNMMTAKLKREKIKALSAVVKSQVILAEMEVMIAESDLRCDLEKMKNSKKIKLDRRYKEESQRNATRDTSQPSTSRGTRSSTRSKLTKTEKKQKSDSSETGNPDSDETMIVETLSPDYTTPVASNSQLTSNVSPKPNTLNSELSLPISIKQEFEIPYPSCTDSTTETHKSAKKQKSKFIKKSPSASKSVTEVSNTTNIGPLDPRLTSTPLKSMPNIHDTRTQNPTFTYVPHSLPMIITQPKGRVTSTYVPVTTNNSFMNPGLYTASMNMPNITQTPPTTTTHNNFYTGKLP